MDGWTEGQMDRKSDIQRWVPHLKIFIPPEKSDKISNKLRKVINIENKENYKHRNTIKYLTY